MKLNTRSAFVPFAIILSACTHKVPTAVDYESDRARIWELEQTIYERRAVGDIQFYLDNSNPSYLGWPFGLEKPTNLDSLREWNSENSFQSGEKIQVTLDGVSVEGDTAIAYFSTHRTRKPGGEVTQEKYQNIHVWTRIGDDWTLMGSFSRKIL